MPRPELPERFEMYDPFNTNEINDLISHFDIKVGLDAEDHPRNPKLHGRKTWGYLWKYGGVTLAPEEKLSEAQARAIAALACYLYASGVSPHLDDRLATAYILAGWERTNGEGRVR